MEKDIYITASKLYDYLKCPHKIWRDIYGLQEEMIKETNPFVEMLWKKGVQHEDRIIPQLGEFLDLRDGNLEERFKKTIQAMKKKTPLIYQGVLVCENMRGIPDLLRLMPDDTYIPVDIKSGMGIVSSSEEEGEEKLKRTYAVQLALYVDVLKKLGFKNNFKGVILDIKSNEIEYNLLDAKGPRDQQTWWNFYEKIKSEVWALMNNDIENKPAINTGCNLCPWYNSCKKWASGKKDLTNIFFVGRSTRDRLNEDIFIKDTDEFLNIDIGEIMKRKEREKKSGNTEFLYRVGEDSLLKALNRAKVLYKTKKPIIYGDIEFPKTKYDLFFDIETDPTQEFVYMHGIYERSEDGEKYIDFTACEISDEAEKEAWEKFWVYIHSLPKNSYTVYYYSKYERTTYLLLQKKYPGVISEEELKEFFNPNTAIDLYYDIIMKKTDWPLGSYSIKAIAQYLGFKWRDKTPSGSLSIQWFNEYLATKDKTMLQRILDYNEDDCKATMILKDGLEKLQG
jgi:predicted RecB family nuclease